MGQLKNLLEDKVRSKNFSLSVIGVGRVGLPLTVQFASVGVQKVIGVDVNADIINKLQNGTLPFKENGLKETFDLVKTTQNIFFTSDYADIADSDVVVICVSTPLTHDFRPQTNMLMSCFTETLSHLRSENEVLLIVRSTVPPRTTTHLLLPTAKRAQMDRLHIAVCPERIVEGYALKELIQLPEIVGSESDVAKKCAAEFFRLLNPEKLISFTDPTTAELAKLFCNIYRYATFALANEFALIAEALGANVNDAIRVANEGYKRAGIPRAGPAGGPCLYKDGYFIDDLVAYEGITRKSWQINEYVPLHIVRSIEADLGTVYSVKIGVLGVTYKRDSDDIRYSPALKIIEVLRDRGAIIVSYDPHVPTSNDIKDVLSSEVVILAVDHQEFSDLDLNELGAKLFYDVLGFFSHKASFFALRNIKYRVFGASVDKYYSR